MISSTGKGDVTRAKILDVTTGLFAVHGFEATTFEMIGKASGTSTGSITHCFRDKTVLARVVYLVAKEQLVEAVRGALDTHSTNLPKTIDAIISACLSWAEAQPEDNILLRKLRLHVDPNEEIGERVQLEPLLEAWAQPLIRNGLLQPLTPTQVYAVTVAPAISEAVTSARTFYGHEPPKIAWKSLLSTMALAALRPANAKSRSGKVSASHAGKKVIPPPGGSLEQRDLF